jgi:N-acyl homoserine lactone hydrolase
VRGLADIQVLHLADIFFLGRWLPVNAWAVSGPGGRVLVDTAVTEILPEIEVEWPLRLHPWPDLGDVVAVVNTHLDFDHCGGNRLFPGLPIFVQRAEYEAVSEPEFLVGWIRFPGAAYELVDGDAEVHPGISVLSTPGHSPGHQAVVVATDEGPVVLGGDVTYDPEEFDRGGTENVDRIRALRPRRVYLSHAAAPWEPGVD